MSHRRLSVKIGTGRISKGPSSNGLAKRTLDFVKRELPNWRDDPDRNAEASEERLNAQLCKYLNASAREKFPMVCFHHEEKQTVNRRIDLSGCLSKGCVLGSTYFSIYDPFVVLEGKRLPAPSREREREYVTGGAETTGGIQRFKLGLHGAKNQVAAMIAYVQDGKTEEWLSQINAWITDLEKHGSANGENWCAGERLTGFVHSSEEGISEALSAHSRVGDVISKSIQLHHFWIVMQTKRAPLRCSI